MAMRYTKHNLSLNSGYAALSIQLEQPIYPLPAILHSEAGPVIERTHVQPFPPNTNQTLYFHTMSIQPTNASLKQTNQLILVKRHKLDRDYLERNQKDCPNPSCMNIIDITEDMASAYHEEEVERNRLRRR